jgi:hypothetical protein
MHWRIDSTSASDCGSFTNWSHCDPAGTGHAESDTAAQSWHDCHKLDHFHCSAWRTNPARKALRWT